MRGIAAVVLLVAVGLVGGVPSAIGAGKAKTPSPKVYRALKKIYGATEPTYQGKNTIAKIRRAERVCKRVHSRNRLVRANRSLCLGSMREARAARAIGTCKSVPACIKASRRWRATLRTVLNRNRLVSRVVKSALAPGGCRSSLTLRKQSVRDFKEVQRLLRSTERLLKVGAVEAAAGELRKVNSVFDAGGPAKQYRQLRSGCKR